MDYSSLQFRPSTVAVMQPLVGGCHLRMGAEAHFQQHTVRLRATNPCIPPYSFPLLDPYLLSDVVCYSGTTAASAVAAVVAATAAAATIGVVAAPPSPLPPSPLPPSVAAAITIAATAVTAAVVTLAAGTPPTHPRDPATSAPSGEARRGRTEAVGVSVACPQVYFTSQSIFCTFVCIRAVNMLRCENIPLVRYTDVRSAYGVLLGGGESNDKEIYK